MTFIWPAFLLSLVIIPVLIIFYARLQKRRKQISDQYGQFGAMRAASGRGPGIRRHVPPAIFLLGLTILLVSLARPQTVVSLPRVEGTVLLAFDVSGSMAATDLKPSRMEAARQAAQDFVQRQPPSVQMGVVAFSDSGISVQIPTNERDLVLAALNRLSPQRGTSLGRGIEAALTAINEDDAPPQRFLTNITPTPTPIPTPMPKGVYRPAVIVLLSDGENNESPDPLAVAQKAADQGIRIYTVGIGSPAGTNLHINGITVHTQLYEEPLRQIARITGGTYFNAKNEQELIAIYDHLAPELVIKPEKMEVTSLFAGISILTLLIGGAFSFYWFNRLP